MMSKMMMIVRRMRMTMVLSVVVMMIIRIRMRMSNPLAVQLVQDNHPLSLPAGGK